jgi:hypothetical protein
MATLIENDLPVSAVMRAVDGPLIITRGAASPPPSRSPDERGSARDG